MIKNSIYIFIFLFYTQQIFANCNIYGTFINNDGSVLIDTEFKEMSTIFFSENLCVGSTYMLHIRLTNLDKSIFNYSNNTFQLKLFPLLNDDILLNSASNNNIEIINTSFFNALEDSVSFLVFRLTIQDNMNALKIGFKPIIGWDEYDDEHLLNKFYVTNINFNIIHYNNLNDEPVVKLKEEDIIFSADTIKDETITQKLEIEIPKTIKGRNLKFGKELYTTESSCKLIIFDHLYVDGDSISVMLNNEWIIENELLLKTPIIKEIQLHDGINFLALHAINLGEIPPNTAAFYLEFSDNTVKRILFSDLENTDVIFIHKEQDNFTIFLKDY